MRKIKEVMRLVHDRKLSRRQTAQAVGIGRAAVSDYLGRSEAAGLSWPLPDGLDDARLEAMLFEERLAQDRHLLGGSQVGTSDTGHGCSPSLPGLHDSGSGKSKFG